MASAVQSQSAPEPAPDAASIEVPAEKLSLEELTRILDVAAALRKEQAVVEHQLNLDEVKAKLRERLLEAARVSGDTVTAEQVDAAVRQYYEQLHEFAEPPRGWRTAAAHAWVRRGPILATAAVVLAAVLSVWGLFSAGMLPGETRDLKLATQQYSQLDETVKAIESITGDPATLEQARAALATAEGYLQQRDGASIEALSSEMEALARVLAAEYSVGIVSEPGQRSGQQRDYTDDQGTRVSGYYVIVEARDARGKPVAVPILNRETGQVELVSRWGEQVPQEVFERLAADKQSDGVLDETGFAVKHRGQRELEMLMPGGEGQALPRQAQITRWE